MMALMESGVRFARARLDRLGLLISWDRSWGAGAGFGISGSMFFFGSWGRCWEIGFVVRR